MLQGNILALKWLYRLAQGRRSFLFLSVLLSILSGGAGLVPLWVFYRMSVPLLQGQSLSEPIWQLPAAALAAIALRYVLQYISWMLAHAVAFNN